MEISIYKNLKIYESISLSKKKTQKLHRKFMSYEIDSDSGITTLLSKNYLSTDKQKLFKEVRDPINAEIIQFAKMHEKTIKKWLVEKSYKLEITDELEKELCDLFEIFDYDKPAEFEYFK